MVGSHKILGVQIFQRPTGGLITILMACLLQSTQIIQELFGTSGNPCLSSIVNHPCAFTIMIQ